MLFPINVTLSRLFRATDEAAGGVAVEVLDPVPGSETEAMGVKAGFQTVPEKKTKKARAKKMGEAQATGYPRSDEVMTTEAMVPEVAMPRPAKKEKKAATKKAANKPATKGAKEPAATKPTEKPVEKKTSDGIRKPQIRVLAALAKSKEPLTRAEISKRGEVDLAMLTEYIGSSDAKIRTKNDKKFKSLLTLGFVKATDQDGGTVYTLTAAGKKALAAAK